MKSFQISRPLLAVLAVVVVALTAVAFAGVGVVRPLQATKTGDQQGTPVPGGAAGVASQQYVGLPERALRPADAGDGRTAAARGRAMDGGGRNNGRSPMAVQAPAVAGGPSSRFLPGINPTYDGGALPLIGSRHAGGRNVASGSTSMTTAAMGGGGSSGAGSQGTSAGGGGAGTAAREGVRLTSGHSTARGATTIKAPEIDGAAGTQAIALLTGILLLAGERARRRSQAR